MRGVEDGSRQIEVAPVHEQVLEDRELAVEVVLLRDDAELGADLCAVHAPDRDRGHGACPR